MVFTAKLRRHKNIWNMWRQAARTGGLVMGVQFHWVTGNDYVTDPLEPFQVKALRDHQDVLLEVIAGDVEPIEEALAILPKAETLRLNPGSSKRRS